VNRDRSNRDYQLLGTKLFTVQSRGKPTEINYVVITEQGKRDLKMKRIVARGGRHGDLLM